jgi:hypothetical protein
MSAPRKINPSSIERDVWTGTIDAPAKLFSALATLFDRVDHPLPTLFGFTLDYVSFLVGVVILWYVVGSVLNQRQSARREPRLAWTMSKLVFARRTAHIIGCAAFVEVCRDC